MSFAKRIEILIDAVTGASDQWFAIESGAGPALICTTGLAGVETAKLQVLPLNIDPAEADPGDWEQVIVGGTDTELDVSTTTLTLPTPGVYRIDIAASAGAVTVGLYR